MAKDKKKKKLDASKILKKEVDVKMPLPDNKLGEALGKKRRVRAPAYLRDSWQELKKVTWPSRSDTWKMTFAVIIFTLLYTLITALADFGLDRAVEKVFL